MKIKIGFFTVLLLLTLLLFPTPVTPAAALAVLLHETGHLLAARLCHIPMKEISFGLFGAGLTPDVGIYSYGKELLLCLAGPLTNLLLGVPSLLLPSSFAHSFALASLFLGGFNLLPIHGFDGGRIGLLLLSRGTSLRFAHGCMTALSFLSLLSLWLLSVYLLLRAAASLSLFVFSLSLFVRLFVKDTHE